MRNGLKVLAVTALIGVCGVAVAPVTGAAPPFHCNQVNMHPNSLPNGQETVPYGPGTMWLTPNSLAIPLAVANVAPFSLPNGLSLAPGPNSNQASITGTPALGSAGTYTFTVELGGTYVLGTICKVSKTYTIVITP